MSYGSVSGEGKKLVDDFRNVMLDFVRMERELSQFQEAVEYVKTQVRNEPRNEIFNNVVCATSKASDQPVHTCSLIRAFASSLNIL